LSTVDSPLQTAGDDSEPFEFLGVVGKMYSGEYFQKVSCRKEAGGQA
jgi:hypothetical protein